MRPIISVANHKGGVGKSTSAINIAAVLGEMGKKSLVIDLDPQGSATSHLGAQSDGGQLLQAMLKAVALPVVRTGCSGVDLVPSGPLLAEARQRFSGAIGTELFSHSLRRTTGDWDCVIIDCPPGMEILTLNALRVSRHILVPVEANTLAMLGLQQMVETVELMRPHNPDLQVLAVLVCRAQPRRRIHGQMMSNLERAFPGKVAPVIRECVALAEAPSRGQPITLFAPNSRGATDYRSMVSWLLERPCLLF
jgi:chromosome partitioning protein